MTTMNTSGAKKCNCRRGMIIITTLFFAVVAAAAFSLAALYKSIV